MQTGRQTAGRLVFAIVAVAVATTACAQPTILIVQEREALVDDQDINLILAPYLAEELATEGRVVPVVWSVADPAFSEWTKNEQVDVSRPDRRFALELAKRHGCDYTIILKAVLANQGMQPRAELLHRGRKIWAFEPKRTDASMPRGIKASREDRDKWQRDAEAILAYSGTLSVIIDGLPDWDLTARSVARTWVQQLAAGPFESLPARPRPNVDSGPLPDVFATGPVPTMDVLAQADALVEAGTKSQAIVFLRRAVDADPTEPVRRLRLAELLMAIGEPQLAAQEARIGASFASDPSPYWILASEAEMLSGNSVAARESLMRALREGSGTAPAAEIAAKLALIDDKPQLALDALQSLDGPMAQRWASVAHALLGQADESSQALAKLETTDLTFSIRDYELLVVLTERAIADLPDALRRIPPNVRTSVAGAHVPEAQRVADLASALSALMSSLLAPAIHEISHDGRRLAHALLAQGAFEVLGFAKTGDEDLGEEAAVTLGEAIKNMQAVREAHAAERRSAPIRKGAMNDRLDARPEFGHAGLWVGIRRRPSDAG